MNTLAVRVFPPVLALCTLAGTARGQSIQFNYDGGSAINGNWSLLLNWTAANPIQPDNRPPVDGGNNVIVNFEIAGGTQTTSNNDRTTAAFYSLNGLRFDHRAIANNDYRAVILTSTDNKPFRFVPQANNVLPSIVHNTNGRIHDIQVPIQLGANLGISGSATADTNGPAQLWLSGEISEVGKRKLSISMAGGAGVYLGGDNKYTDNTDFNGGVLILGHNNALGVGGNGVFVNVTNSFSAPIIRSVHGRRWDGTGATAPIAINNAVALLANAQFGEANYVGALRLRQALYPNVAAMGTRRINLAGGLDQTLDFAAGIQSVAGSTLQIIGDTPPDLDKAGKIVSGKNDPKSNHWGSRAVWSGGFTNAMAGNVEIRSATLDIQGDMGTMAQPIGSLITIGDGTEAGRAAFIGRQPNRGVRPAIPPLVLNFTPAGGITPSGVKINPKARLQPGASSGIMAIDAGTVEMIPGSSFGVTLNGTVPGNGDGFYGQLLLQNGAAMTLRSSGFDRPILGIDVQTWDATTNLDNFTPAAGMSFVIVDQDTSIAPSLYLPPDQFGYGGSMFMNEDGLPLDQNAMFSDSRLPPGMFFQIDYFGGDTGNDVEIMVVPTPAMPGLLASAAMVAALYCRRTRNGARTF